MGPYLIDEGYGCLLLLLLFQMVWMVMTMGQKIDSFAPFAAHLEEKKTHNIDIDNIVVTWTFMDFP